MAQVYVSHVYSQVAPDLWAQGKSQSLGVKARFGRFRADLHQRAQEKTVRHEKLHRTSVVVHKPFYAADLLLEDSEVKGVQAVFRETAHAAKHSSNPAPTPADAGRACNLSTDHRCWFNFFDYIDADRKPLDQDPEVEIVDIGDCPQIFFSKRVKARMISPDDDESASVNSSSDSRLEQESSKFGHERSHICYLGAASGVAPAQIKITKQRINELSAMADEIVGDAVSHYRVYWLRLLTSCRTKLIACGTSMGGSSHCNDMWKSCHQRRADTSKTIHCNLPTYILSTRSTKLLQAPSRIPSMCTVLVSS